MFRDKENKSITRSDFKTKVREMKLEISQEMIDRVFIEADINNDQLLQIEELIEYINQKNKILRSAFNQFDHNDSGYIKVSEFKKTLDLFGVQTNDK